MKPLVSARGEHLGCVLAKLTDHSHGDLLAFLYLKGSADVAVGTGKGFVVEVVFVAAAAHRAIGAIGLCARRPLFCDMRDGLRGPICAKEFGLGEDGFHGFVLDAFDHDFDFGLAFTIACRSQTVTPAPCERG